jgi:glycosyltransferase involved in cell wall biosynthesis
VQEVLGDKTALDKDISTMVDFTFLDEPEKADALTTLLKEYAPKTRNILVIHGTNERQIIPRCSVPCKGLWSVVESFLHNNPMWQLRVRHFENRGLVILERVKSSKKSLEEKAVVVIIPSYNNSQYFIANLESIFGQSYSNFRIIYIDDASPDGTGNLVESYLDKHGYKNKVTLIKNRTRLGAMENLYYAVHSCKDEEVVVAVDGDDQLAHSNVLHKINKIYQNPDIWMSYGGLKDFLGIEQKPPKGNYLSPNHGSSGSHRINRYFATTSPRTFYAKLFKLVKQEDLLYKGIHSQLMRNFFPSAHDIAFMLPMGEMAQDNQMHYEEDTLYLYNNFTSLNDFRTGPTLQWECDQLVRRLTPYQPIKDLFAIELKKRPWQRGILNLTHNYPLRGGY